MVFDWDDANRDHLARHGVSPEEAEEACSGEAVYVDSYGIDGELRVELVGMTGAGRVLKLLTTDRNELIRVLTAFDATRRWKQVYLQSTRGEI